MPNLSANLSGYGDVNAVTITTTGNGVIGDDLDVVNDLTAGTIASDSTVVAATVLSTTASGSAAAPAIKVGAATAPGIYRVASQWLGLTDGVSYRLGVLSNEVQILNANLAIQSGIVTSGILTPAQITSNQTDYNPFSTNQYLYHDVRLTSDAARTINSMVSGVPGKQFRLWNCNTAAGRNITLLHDDGATGTAARRFWCPNLASAVIPPAGCVVVWYDTTDSRWRVCSGY